MPQPKGKEAGSFSKYDRQKLQRLETQGSAASGSVGNFAETSNLPASKVRHFLHSKHFNPKFTLGTPQFKKLKASSRFKIEIWCMEVAYVEKRAKYVKGVKYLLFRQDLCDRNVDARGMKNKRFQRNSSCNFD